MLRAALFIRAPEWKQLEYPPPEEQVNKMCSVRTTEYYPALNKNEALIHATTWVNCENMIPNERSQAQKATQCMTLFPRNAQNRQIHETVRLVVARGTVCVCVCVRANEEIPLGGNDKDVLKLWHRLQTFVNILKTSE